MDPTEYFPKKSWAEVYCPHLGFMLGPCQECDSIQRKEYEDAEWNEWLSHLTPYERERHDSLTLEDEVYDWDFEWIPIAHMETVTVDWRPA